MKHQSALVISVAVFALCHAHFCLQIANGQTPEPSELRVLQFPEDRSLGTLYTGPAADTPFSELNVFGDQLKKLGPAKGQVELPPDVFVRLDVPLDACKDLQPLSELPPDSVHFLYFNIDSPISGQLQHISQLTSLRILHLRSCPVKDSDIAEIANLRNLESIQCSAYGFADKGFGVTDESLKVFGQLPKLKRLLLRSNPVTDEGLKFLTECEHLETLTLSDSKVSGEGLNCLAMLQNLKSLSMGAYLDGSPVDFKGMKTFGGLTHLEHLDLAGSRVSDEELTQISSLTNLKSLTLDNSNVTDAGLAALEGMDQLEKFRFYRKNVEGLGDLAAEELAKLPNLRKITAHWNLTARGIAKLSSMKKLESIDLSYTVTDEEMLLVAKMTGLKRLTLQNCPVTDAGVASLASMTQLENLSLFRTRATTKCLETVSKLKTLVAFSLASVAENFELRPENEWDQLATMSQLERLSISGFLLDDEHWNVIGNLENLNYLRFESRLPAGAAAARAISRLTKLNNLALRQCHFSTDDIRCIATLENLEYLSLHGHIDEQSLKELAKLPSIRMLQVGTDRKLSSETERFLRENSNSLQNLNLRESGQNALLRNAQGIVVSGDSEQQEKLSQLIGNEPPKLVGETGEFDLEQFKGKPTIVYFWRSRGYNREVAPAEHLAEAVRKFPDQDIQVVGVHRTKGAERMEPFLIKYDIAWPCIVDKDNESAKRWKNRGDGRDYLYLIDKNGKVKMAQVYVGDVENAIRQMLVDEGS